MLKLEQIIRNLEVNLIIIRKRMLVTEAEVVMLEVEVIMRETFYKAKEEETGMSLGIMEYRFGVVWLLEAIKAEVVMG